MSLQLEAGPKKGKSNPNSAVIWHTPPTAPADAPKVEVGKNKDRSRDYYFGRTIASVTAHDGLVYATDAYNYLFCFDAKTGNPYWVDELSYRVMGQPLWADGKVYVGTEDGDVFIFAHGKEKKLLAKVECDEAIHAGLIFANGTLFITAERTIYAIRNPK